MKSKDKPYVLFVAEFVYLENNQKLKNIIQKSNIHAIEILWALKI
jgi:hypothetical protein